MQIVETQFFNAGQQTFGGANPDNALYRMTVCVATADTDEILTGRHQAAPGAYDEEAGRSAALADVERQIAEIVYRRTNPELPRSRDAFVESPK